MPGPSIARFTQVGDGPSYWSVSPVDPMISSVLTERYLRFRDCLVSDMDQVDDEVIGGQRMICLVFTTHKLRLEHVQ